VQIDRREPADAPDYYLVAVLMPLEGRPGANAKLPTNFRRHRDLALCSQARLGDCHTQYITAVLQRLSSSRCPPHCRPNTGDKLRSSIACAGFVCFIPLFDGPVALR